MKIKTEISYSVNKVQSKQRSLIVSARSRGEFNYIVPYLTSSDITMYILQLIYIEVDVESGGLCLASPPNIFFISQR